MLIKNGNHDIRKSCLVAFLGLSSATLLIGQHAFAQVVPDNTLPINSQVDSSNRITQGTLQDSALFHSFEFFSIPTGEAYTFIDPGVSTIFSRVTGPVSSHIDGTLIIDGNADLFLLNPHGILFGPDSALNVNGSFVATTASSITFSDRGEFSAVNPTSALPLSINATAPVGLRFGNKQPAVIINEGNNLRVGKNDATAFEVTDDNGEKITFSGGDGNLTLVGGSVVTTGTILAAEDNQDLFVNEVNLVGVDALNGNLVVQVNLDGEVIRVSSQSSSGEAAPIILSEEFTRLIGPSLDLITNNEHHLIVEDPDITVSAGDVVIYRDPDTLSRFAPGETPRAFEVGSQDILNIIASHDTLIYADGFRTPQDDAFNPGDIVADTLNISTANNLIIQDTELRIEGVVDNNPSLIRSGNDIVFDNVQLFGSLGDLIVLNSDNGDIRLNESPIKVFTQGDKAATDLSLTAAGEISLINSPLLSLIDNESTPVINPSGNLGDITIRADSLIIQNESRRRDLTDAVLVINLGEGDGGEVNIQTIGDIFIEGGITSNAFQSAQPGTISIESKNGNISFSRALLYTRLQDRLSNVLDADRAPNVVNTSTSPRNSTFTIPEDNTSVIPGNIVVIARNGDINFVENSEIRTDTFGSGDAGNITIQTDNGQISVNNSEFSANTFGAGNGGQINISATDKASIQDSEIFSQSTIDSETPNDFLGNGGEVSIQASQVSLNRSLIFATTARGGAGGSIDVTGANSVVFSDGTRLNAGTSGSGVGGNINVNVPRSLSEKDSLATPSVRATGQNVTVSSGSEINAGTTGEGASGNVQLGARNILLVDNSIVTVNSTSSEENFIPGDAGTLITNSRYVQLNNGELTATSNASNGGNINMRVDNVLLMRDGSLISAQSFGPESQDGNIQIDTGALVTSLDENNDIVARSSNQGNVDITAEAILGFIVNEELDLTENSEITATGTINLDLGIDSSEGLTEFEEEPREVELTQGCESNENSNAASYFDIGSGGTPPQPDAPLNSDTVTADWIPLEIADGNNSETINSSPVSDNLSSSSSAVIVPTCQGH